MDTYTAREDDRSVRLILITRLSDDPRGEKIDHAAQVRKIRELHASNAAMQGWPPIRDEDWYSDSDTSASKEDVRRLRWEAALAEIAATDRRTTKVVVLGYKQDRMMRLLGDPQMLANALDRKRGELWTALEGHISVKKGGRAALYFNGTVAALEPEATAARAQAGIAEAAINGRPHGTVGYGWKRIYASEHRTGRAKGHQVIVPEQQAVVADMARRVLAGESLRSIASDLNGRAIAAPGAGAVQRRDPETREPVEWCASTWNPQKIRQILLRKANIGIRVHRSGTGNDMEITEYPGQWEPLISEDIYRQVVGVLSDDRRRSSLTNTTKHWLSGIATCGECGGKMRVQRRNDRGRTPVYRCEDIHVSKVQAKTDAVVEQAILEILASPEARASLRTDDNEQTQDALDRLAGMRQRLAELEDDYMAGTVKRDQWLRMSAKMTAAIDQGEAELSRTRNTAVYAELVNADDIGAAWEATPLDRRRAVVSAVASVVIHKTTKRGKAAFDPASIVVTPKLAS